MDINPEKLQDPTISYITKPEINARSYLLEKRRTDGL